MASSKSSGSDRQEARAVDYVKTSQEADAAPKKLPPTQRPRRRLTLLKPPSLGSIFPLPEHDQQRRLGHPCARALAQTECHPGRRPGSHTLT